MEVTVNFRISQEGIKNAFNQGFVVKEKHSQKIDISLISQEERNVISKHSKIVDSKAYLRIMDCKARDVRDSGIYYTQCYASDDSVELSPSQFKVNENNHIVVPQEHLVAIYIAEVQKWEKDEAKIREGAKKEKATLENIDAACESLSKTIGEKVYRSSQSSLVIESEREAIRKRVSYGSLQDFAEDAAKGFVKAEKEWRDYLEDQKQKEIEISQKELEKKANEMAISKWIKENGSELLKARYEEDMNYKSLFATEYVAKHFPEFGFWEDVCEWDGDSVDSYSIQNADLEQIETLRNLRARYQSSDHFDGIELERNKHEDEDGDVFHKDFAKMRLSLFGSAIYVYCFLNDYPVEVAE